MTRDRDVFVPLGDRVRIAREAKADLFVSIHADRSRRRPRCAAPRSIPAPRRPPTPNRPASPTARTRRTPPPARFGEGPSDIADILQELTLRETRGFSSGFARTLMGQLGPVMEMSAKPHREAGFRVLRSPDVPSVLVELGYLSSKRDLDLLQSRVARERDGLDGQGHRPVLHEPRHPGRPAGPTRRAAAIAPVSP